MTSRRRYALLLAGGFFLLLVLIFQQFLIANVVLPVATVIWAWLRIFVFSIDQHVYWWLLISLLVLVPLIRELRKTGPSEPEHTSKPNPWLERVGSWRGSILADVQETGEQEHRQARPGMAAGRPLRDGPAEVGGFRDPNGSATGKDRPSRYDPCFLVANPAAAPSAILQGSGRVRTLRDGFAPRRLDPANSPLDRPRGGGILPRHRACPRSHGNLAGDAQ